MAKQRKFTMKNRHGLEMTALLEFPVAKKSKGLAFVMHGTSGTKEQAHVAAIAEALIESGYGTIRFDATHSFGESGGSYEDLTATSHAEDLEDVISWAKKQEFFSKPFILSGHSLGAFASALYAERHPWEVKALVLVSAVVSGQLYIDAYPKKDLEEYRRAGWKISESATVPGRNKMLRWNQFEQDILKYDLIRDADSLTMPTLLVVGSEDKGTPLSHQQILFGRLRGKKELDVIEGGPHTFVDASQIGEIRGAIRKWVSGLSP